MTRTGTYRPSQDLLPSVSVVVPTRNRPELLARAVAAIFGQDYPGEIECVVVFDQSEPSAFTPQLAARHAGRRRLRVVCNEHTAGLAGARNTGVLATEGQLVAFCDDDDTWHPDKLRRQVELLQESGRDAVASCGIVVRHSGRATVRLPVATEFVFRDLLRSRHMELHPSTFVVARETLLERIGLIDEGIPGSYAEDYEWLLRAARVGPIVAVREPLVDVYWHQASWFLSRWEMIAGALIYLLEKYPEFGDEPAGRSRVEGQIAIALAASGHRSEARTWARHASKLDRRQLRAYLAFLVSLRLLSPNGLQRLANAAGRGL